MTATIIKVKKLTKCMSTSMIGLIIWDFYIEHQQFQARLKEAASLDGQVLLGKLRDLLESLKGRVAGRNKDDIEEAISMVS